MNISRKRAGESVGDGWFKVWIEQKKKKSTELSEVKPGVVRRCVMSSHEYHTPVPVVKCREANIMTTLVEQAKSQQPGNARQGDTTQQERGDGEEGKGREDPCNDKFRVVVVIVSCMHACKKYDASLIIYCLTVKMTNFHPT